MTPAAPTLAPPSRRPWLRPLLWTLLAAALLGIGGLAAYEQTQRAASAHAAAAAAALPDLGRVPDFALTNRDGTVVRLADLAGAPWVADFVFTTCASSCPLLSARMARLDHDLPPADTGLRLVSFSVDPDHDTPPVLDAYARTFAASRRWLFLTGPAAAVRHLSRDGFKLALEPAAGAAPREAILHSTRFVLVDARGVIRGTYPALEPRALAQLAADARALAGASSDARLESRHAPAP